MNDETPTSANATGTAEDRSLTDDVHQLALDARLLAEAEFAYQKSRAAFAGSESKRIAILGLLAVFFGFFALMALVVGCVIALAPSLTAWGATAAVCGALVLFLLICVAVLMQRVRRMKTVLKNETRD